MAFLDITFLGLMTFTISEGLTPSFSSISVSSIHPYKVDAEIHLDINLEPTETLGQVIWFKDNSNIPLATYKSEDRENTFASTNDQKYKADVDWLESSGSLRLKLLIYKVFNEEDKLSAEANYTAKVKLSRPEGVETAYYVKLVIQVATDLSMEFEEVREVGTSTTITCIARGWKPPANFVPAVASPDLSSELPFLVMSTEKYNRDKVISAKRMNVTTIDMDRGQTESVAQASFKIANAYRGIEVSCAAWNEATGRNNSFIVSQIFDETEPHNVSEGEECLYPPSTARSQCDRKDKRGSVCVYGRCDTVYGTFCDVDEDCGHNRSSRLECLGGYCLCHTDYFEPTPTWYEPYCQPSLGLSCGPGMTCNNSNTQCKLGSCECDESIAFSTNRLIRGSQYAGCSDRSDIFRAVGGALGSREEATSQTSDTAGIVTAIVCAVCIIGLIAMVGVARRLSLREDSGGYGDMGRNFPWWKSNESKKSKKDHKGQGKHLKSQSAPEQRLSMSSTLRFKSEGKRLNRGPDYGESSADDFTAYFKTLKKAEKAKKGGTKPQEFRKEANAPTHQFTKSYSHAVEEDNPESNKDGRNKQRITKTLSAPNFKGGHDSQYERLKRRGPLAKRLRAIENKLHKSVKEKKGKKRNQEEKTNNSIKKKKGRRESSPEKH